MASSAHLAHQSNDHHARGIHDDKKYNHKVNYKEVVFKAVTLFRKFEKCCNNFSCEDCKKTKRDAMKLQQVKAISISPLYYEQTGTKTLRWPPQNNFDPNSGSSPEYDYNYIQLYRLIVNQQWCLHRAWYKFQEGSA